MKKLFGLVALIALSFVLPARAETVKVFTWYVGQVQSGQAGWKDAVKAYYVDESPDFGYISGPKATDYYSGSVAGKYTTYAYVAQGVNGDLGFKRFCIYQADRYSLEKEYPRVAPAKGNGYSISGCVLESVAVPGTYCALIYVSAQTTDFTKLGEMATSILDSYPDAKLFVIHGRGDQCVTEAAESELATYLTETLKMTKVADGTSAAIYSLSVPTKVTSRDLAEFTPSAVNTTGFGGEFVFPSYYPVVFKDYDGTVLKSELIKENDSVTPPTPPERAGYNFIGWDHESAEFEHVTEAITATAQYEAAGNNHIVTFRTWDGEWIADVVVEDGAKVEAIPAPVRQDYTFIGWQLEGVTYDFETPVTADITLTAAYEIVRVQEIVDEADFMRRMAAGYPKEVTYKLTKDLDFSEVNYTAAVLLGTLDGQGHSISGLMDSPVFTTIDGGTVKDLVLVNFTREHKSGSSMGGLLANRVNGGLISNVEIVDSVFSAHNSNCGLAAVVYTVAADADGTPSVVSNCVVRNCSMNGISGCDLGGVVGSVEGNSEIVDCKFLVDDESAVCLGPSVSYAGGIASKMVEGRVVRCYTEGSYVVSLGGVTSGNTGAGGIVAAAISKSGWIIDCTNTANVAATGGILAAGGIFGRNQKTKICVQGCVNYGSVSVSGYAGGDQGSGNGAGGIVGGAWGTSPSARVIVTDCKNYGSVVSEDYRPAGGIVGFVQSADMNSSFFYMTNCVNVADVAATNIAGGLVGRLRGISISGLDIVNCGNAGVVFAATNAVGGVVGSLGGQGQNNYKTFIADKIFNVMNCGALSTESGVVGKFVGSIVTEPYNDNYQNSYGFDAHGFFCPDQVGVELTGAVYGKEEGSGVTIDAASVTNLAASTFTDKSVVKKLNVYAAANELPLWVQTKTSPDLSLFSEGINFGLMILVR